MALLRYLNLEYPNVFMDAKMTDSPKQQNRLALMFRALAHRNYRLYAGGQLISLVGTWIQTVAQSWLVYRLTDSAILLGLVGFASQIPVSCLPLLVARLPTIITITAS
jgi:hypothetical protein